MSIEPVVGEHQPTTNRKVWVLNRDGQPYVEDFKGRKIVVPPNDEKKLKMPFLEARQFLGQPKQPAEQRADGTWITGPKALYTEEIEEEVEKAEKNAEQQEKGLATTCMICEKKFDTEHALKIHVGRAHPDMEEVTKI